MENLIQLLPDAVANQIAAGEVVQRPASVVKELLENSVDAGATCISLKTVGAGKTLIQVIDNGKGMTQADCLMSFERHATSKIRSSQDIFSILTMGFRGEALASISAVAQVELKSKTEDDEIGYLVKNEGNDIVEQKPVACQKGTVISVKNLFFNVPARRQFLKSDNVENKHIIEEFFRVALANPAIEFNLIQNDKNIYHCPKGNQRQRIVSLFGKNYNERLAPVSEKTNLFEIEGYINKPEFARKSRGEQYLFVNGRFIKSRYLHHAIVKAYDGLIAADEHPGYFLYLTLPASNIDINIHPTKTEIKFKDEQSIYQLLQSIVKRSIGVYNLSPSIDFDALSSIELSPVSNLRPNTDFTKERSSGASNSSKENYSFSSPKTTVNRHIPSPPTNLSDIEKINEELEVDLSDEEREISRKIDSHQSLNLGFEKDDSINCLKIFDKFLLCFFDSQCWLIDVKRAKQRILFNQLKKGSSASLSQVSLFEELIYVSANDQKLIAPALESMQKMGLVIEPFGEDTMVLRAVPQGLDLTTVSEVFETILAELRNINDFNDQQVQDILAKRMALAGSLHYQCPNNAQEQKWLVQALLNTDAPSISPFGKNIFKNLTKEELAKIIS